MPDEITTLHLLNLFPHLSSLFKKIYMKTTLQTTKPLQEFVLNQPSYICVKNDIRPIHKPKEILSLK